MAATCELASDRPGTQWTRTQPTNTAFISSVQICSEKATGEWRDYLLFSKRELPRWPKRTDVACFNCAANFDGPPLPLPYEFDEIRQTWKVGGCFCGVPCAKRFLVDQRSPVMGLQRMWLRRLCGVLFKDGEGRADVPAAPPRRALRTFGGHLPLDEYRGKRGNAGTVRILEPPLISYPVVAHIERSDGQLGMVKNLKRPPKQRKTAAAAPAAAAAAPKGLLRTMPEEAEESKSSASARNLRRFLRPRPEKKKTPQKE